MASPLNYFNYFTEIEETFVRRRSKHLHLSPMDWALIESWKELGIPLHIVLRGVEKSFDSWESKPRKRSVKTLLYCQEEVEAQYAEWRESRVGAGETPPLEEEAAEQDTTPFSKARITEHLASAREKLQKVSRPWPREMNQLFEEALRRADSLLQSLQSELSSSSTIDARKIETSLTGIDRMLAESLHQHVSGDLTSTYQAEMKKQMAPHRKHMEASIYQQTLDNFVLLKLRSHFGIPRLSLFYL